MELFETICSTDPAVEVLGSRIDKYWISRDLKHLKLRPGKEPVRYYLRPISRQMVRAFIEPATTQDGRDVRAFMAAVASVKGPGFSPSSGGEWRPEWSHGRASGGFQLMTEEECDLFPVEDVYEIGRVAYDRCFFRDGSAPCYRVAPSCLRALERAVSPPVEQALAALDIASERYAQRAAESLGRLYETPTDATATDPPESESAQTQPSAPP